MTQSAVDRSGRTLTEAGQIPRSEVLVIGMRTDVITVAGMSVNSGRGFSVHSGVSSAAIRAHLRRGHSFLLLSPVAKPNPYDFFLQLEAVC